jgi:hypothetical protein
MDLTPLVFALAAHDVVSVPKQVAKLALVCIASIMLFLPVSFAAGSGFSSQSSNIIAPSNIIYYVPIKITNTQATATPAHFQQLINVTSSLYSNYESGSLSNIEFFYQNGTLIPSWLEQGLLQNSTRVINASASGKLNESDTTSYWLLLDSGISANSAITVYMGIANSSVNLLNNINDGEAPQLSGTYAEYDDGYKVFDFYDNFAGNTLNSSKWVGSTSNYTVSNGLIFSSSSTASYSIYSKAQNFSTGEVTELFANASGALAGGVIGIAYTLALTANTPGNYISVSSSWSSEGVSGTTSLDNNQITLFRNNELGQIGMQYYTLYSTPSEAYASISSGGSGNSTFSVFYTANSMIKLTDLGTYGGWYVQYILRRAAPPENEMPTYTIGNLTGVDGKPVLNINNTAIFYGESEKIGVPYAGNTIELLLNGNVVAGPASNNISYDFNSTAKGFGAGSYNITARNTVNSKETTLNLLVKIANPQIGIVPDKTQYSFLYFQNKNITEFNMSSHSSKIIANGEYFPDISSFADRQFFYASDSSNPSVINITNGEVAKTLPISCNGNGLFALSPSGNILAFTCYDDNIVYMINTTTYSYTDFYPLYIDIRALAFSPNGDLYVGSEFNATVWSVPGQSGPFNRLKTIPLSNVDSFAFSPDGRYALALYNSNSKIVALNTSNISIISYPAAPSDILALDPSTTYGNIYGFYESNSEVRMFDFNTSTLKLKLLNNGFYVFNGAPSVAFSPNSIYSLIATQYSGFGLFSRNATSIVEKYGSSQDFGAAATSPEIFLYNGSDAELTANLGSYNNQLDGTVDLYKNGVLESNAVVDSEYNITLLPSPANYTVTISSNSDSNYSAASVKYNFSIVKSLPEINLTGSASNFSKPLVNFTYNGSYEKGFTDVATVGDQLGLSVYLDGNYLASVLGGLHEFNLTASAGKYEVVANTIGNLNYTPNSYTRNFTISKAVPGMQLESCQNFTYNGSGCAITGNVITFKNQMNASLRLTGPGENSIIAFNSLENFVPKTLSAGRYTVNLSVPGNGNYTGKSSQGNFTVYKASPQPKIVVSGNATSTTISGNQTSNYSSVLPISLNISIETFDGQLNGSVYLNGKPYASTNSLKTINFGAGSLAPGNYTIVFNSTGNTNYTAFDPTLKLHVLQSAKTSTSHSNNVNGVVTVLNNVSFNTVDGIPNRIFFKQYNMYASFTTNYAGAANIYVFEPKNRSDYDGCKGAAYLLVVNSSTPLNVLLSLQYNTSNSGTVPALCEGGRWLAINNYKINPSSGTINFSVQSDPIAGLVQPDMLYVQQNTTTVTSSTTITSTSTAATTSASTTTQSTTIPPEPVITKKQADNTVYIYAVAVLLAILLYYLARRMLKGRGKNQKSAGITPEQQPPVAQPQQPVA